MIELTLLVHGVSEPTDLERLLPEIDQAMIGLDVQHEAVVVGASPELEPVVAEHGALFVQIEHGKYGTALKRGYESAQGRYVLTIDDNIAGFESLIDSMWRERDSAELVIASRYVSGSSVKIPLVRRFVTVLFNRVIGALLSIDVKDPSSGVRLTRREGAGSSSLAYRGCGTLVEQILKVLADGRSVKEVPADYDLSRRGRPWYTLAARSLGLARTSPL